MIDSHCHLADKQFDADRAEVIVRAMAAGVTQMICIADSLDEAEMCQQIAQMSEHIYCTAGVHPHAAASFDPASDSSRLRELLAHPKCRAVGEIGLDYHYMRSPKDVQQRVFESQLALAKELKLPTVVHCREAVEDVWTIVNHVKPVKLVMHCCTERWEDAERFIAAGYFLSFTGIATYPKSDEIRRTIERCPLTQLMIETDSPYLAPVPYRGKRNEPAYVAEVLRCIGEIKKLSAAQVDSATTQNAIDFFGLSP